MFLFLNEEAEEDDNQSLIDLFQMSQNEILQNKEAGPSNLNTPRKKSSECKEEEVESKLNFTSSVSQPEQKIAMLRQRGKERSKQARERKKRYIEELETRIKDLEKENLRLQNLLEYDGRVNLNMVPKGKPTLLTPFEKLKKKISDIFIDPEKMQYKEDTRVKVIDWFRAQGENTIKGHQALIEKGFETLIETFIPNMNRQYWRDTGKSDVFDFEVIKKLGKITKYQRNEYIEEHNLSEVDIGLSGLDPNKRQFRFMTEVIIPREVEIKQQFQEGVNHLLKAKDIIMKSLYDIYVYKSAVIRSGIFSDKQIINSLIAEIIQPREKISFTDLWKLQKKQLVIKYDLTQDKLLSKVAKKYLAPEDQKLEFEYTAYANS